MTGIRTEHDSLGSVEVPADAYWGAHTQRAVENFPISGRGIGTYPELVTALALVKQAAARANAEIGVLESSVADVIDAACQDIVEGAFHDQFVVDLIQGGAGTSSNMNANEVIANRALERLGHPRGRYDVVHPLEHVNRSQSTNDVYPTAVKIALTIGLRRLIAEHARLAGAFRSKGWSSATTSRSGARSCRTRCR